MGCKHGTENHMSLYVYLCLCRTCWQKIVGGIILLQTREKREEKEEKKDKHEPGSKTPSGTLNTFRRPTPYCNAFFYTPPFWFCRRHTFAAPYALRYLPPFPSTALRSNACGTAVLSTAVRCLRRFYGLTPLPETHIPVSRWIAERFLVFAADDIGRPYRTTFSLQISTPAPLPDNAFLPPAGSAYHTFCSLPPTPPPAYACNTFYARCGALCVDVMVQNALFLAVIRSVAMVPAVGLYHADYGSIPAYLYTACVLCIFSDAAWDCLAHSHIHFPATL